MTAANHAITGAVLALIIKRPEVAIPASLASHFIIDSLPHFKVSGEALGRNHKKLFWVANIIDMLVATALLIMMPVMLGNTVAAWITLACMIVAISPDLAWVYRLVDQMKNNIVKQKGRLNRFHSRIQWSESQPGIIAELAWFGLMWLVLAIKI